MRTVFNRDLQHEVKRERRGGGSISRLTLVWVLSHASFDSLMLTAGATSEGLYEGR